MSNKYGLDHGHLVKGQTCVHVYYWDRANQCGRPVITDGPHGWLCEDHAREVGIRRKREGEE